MFSTDTIIHFLTVNEKVVLPTAFTYPFNYTPHELSIKASKEIQHYLENQEDFNGGFDLLGKMFGVLVVKTTDDKIAYLAAFSGKIDEKTYLDGFVPPVFDTVNPNGFYKKDEGKLNLLNSEIARLENDYKLQDCKQKIAVSLANRNEEIAKLKLHVKQAKQRRQKQREEAKSKLNELEYARLETKLSEESVILHFQLKDLKRFWNNKITLLEQERDDLEAPIIKLKELRKKQSINLQKQLHSSYQFLNAKQETKNLLQLFLDYPPAGAGECAAPKLLQFAYKNNLQPIAMAEFWWGVSPNSAIREHKQYYPACKSRCKPILGFMLEGLTVEKNPALYVNTNFSLDILYEDSYLLVVNKPHEFLSVPGKIITDCVLNRVADYLSEKESPIMVHRLDMSTSGILLVAKNEDVYKHLQQQFITRTVEKRYVAVLDGIISEKKGVINIPLRVDLENRPRQLVCYEYGKPSITRFEVIAYEEGKTRVYFYPETGRTHQLRVHAAHKLGLHTPIVGDDLYGVKGERLYLHAEKLTFQHPITKERLSVTSKVPF